MGCDIHIMAEVKRNGRWEKNQKAVFKNPWYDPKVSDWDLAKEEFISDPDSGRSYDWFSVLADVRNGYGFAGVRTGSGFNIISEPKGVPDDASPEWLEEVKQWDGDMHSKSWLSIDELESFNWDQESGKEGIISLDQYRELRSTPNACPSSWSGWSSGGNILIVNTETADMILDMDPNLPLAIDELNRDEVYEGKIESILDAIVSGTPASEFNIYVKYYWTITYREWFDWKIKTTIEPLRELANEFEDARIVFGFDN